MNASIAALAYLAAGVLFILSLRGLSSPVTSRRGNTLGMVGMALAVGVTLLTLGTSGALDPLTLALIAGGVVVGGGAGAVIANRVPMTAMPQLHLAFLLYYFGEILCSPFFNDNRKVHGELKEGFTGPFGFSCRMRV